ncbi:hypothetical protein QR680_000742 [Steinernema hermaphroditum]|uniref:G-protein coupled receptors family 1 profile domain-containing protein n=1 Tax=Steinernema hermaphroditum TaxID=289476 RepID=A0AA39GXQ5_9BILA|nr:hypothetical protein QR680_000742 [Steinernema hermaphroditum]
MLRLFLLYTIVILGLLLNGFVFHAYTRHKKKSLHVFEMTQTFLGCTVYGFFGGTLSLMSVYQPALMALEWCVIVLQPFMAKCITWSNRIAAVVGSALTILAVTIPPLFGVPAEYASFDHADFCCYDFTAKDTKTRLFFVYLFTLGFFIPIAIFVLSLVLMARQLRNAGKEVRVPLGLTLSAVNVSDDRSDHTTTAFRSPNRERGQ